jgi:hypothetical protein
VKKPITCDDIETAINNGARMSEVEALIDEWAACAEAHQQWESEVRGGETRTFEQWYANEPVAPTTDCPTPEWEDHSVLFQQCRARYHARVQAEEREVRLRAARLRAVGLTERDYQIEKDFLG